MRIWGIIVAGAGLTLGASAPAVASGAALPVMGKSFVGRPAMHPPIHSGTSVHRWGPRYQGRWYAGWRAPGGWAGYRRPVVGYVLPRYWISPTYRIANYGAYGLPAPVSGYGWSRYYDDAVMTDRDGRVRDYRSDVAWDDAPPPGVAYDDDVTARNDSQYDDRYDGPDNPPPPYSYEGRWSGSWRDRDGRVQSGEFEGRFDGDVRGRPGTDYDAPPYDPAPYAVSPHQGGPGQPIVTTTQAPGTYANGYYYPGVTTTTIVIQPTVTTHSITETSYVRSAPRRKVRSSCRCK
jgi:hypothetical protein